MEKIRTIITACLGLSLLLFATSMSYAQEAETDSLRLRKRQLVDSLRIKEKPIRDVFESTSDDTLAVSTIQDTIGQIDSFIDSTLFIIQPEIYGQRNYISKGIADDVKNVPNIFIQNQGPVGSPQIVSDYLNVPGTEIRVNGLPYIFNSIYRPYVMGIDLNSLPWEIFKNLEWRSYKNLYNGLDISLGRPDDNVNRSDVEVSQGGYEYKSARWRYFRPLFSDGFGYFTVGFKKSDGYLFNADYDSYHVTGGIEKSLFGGFLKINSWKHFAKVGQNSFDYRTAQLGRQNRTIYRHELYYSLKPANNLTANLTGLYQRNDQKITGYNIEHKNKIDLAGGKLDLTTSYGNRIGTLGFDLYDTRLYGIEAKSPSYYKYSVYLKDDGAIGKINSKLNLAYDWNSIDKNIILPSAYVGYDMHQYLNPFVSIVKSRSLPDLYLRNFDDNVSGLGLGSYLETYEFKSAPNLKSPKASIYSIGFDSKFWVFNYNMTVSAKDIEDQIYISYSKDSLGNLETYPINFDDEYIEISSTVDGELGLFTGELSASFREWSDDFFADGLEKGPAVIGSGRLSFRRNFFVPDLYLGGSMEFRVSSRRDYRAIDVGLADGFAVLSGRFEFEYKDITFWINDENLTNEGYFTWWPYYETARIVWWGFRWNFYD